MTNLNDALQIFWYYTEGQSLCYYDTNNGWWATPSSLWNLHSKWPTPFEKRWLQQIFAYNVSTVRDSEKGSITTNIKSTTGFPTSCRWSLYVAHNSRKGGQKLFSFFWIKVNFSRIYSATKFLYVKTSSGKVVVQPFPHLTLHRHWHEE